MLPEKSQISLIPWFPGEFSFVPITITRKKEQEFKEVRICTIIKLGIS